MARILLLNSKIVKIKAEHVEHTSSSSFDTLYDLY
jgi:hypothetical protein